MVMDKESGEVVSVEELVKRTKLRCGAKAGRIPAWAVQKGAGTTEGNKKRKVDDGEDNGEGEEKKRKLDEGEIDEDDVIFIL